VINVIEDPAERREALINAWELTRKVLLVAAQVLINDSSRGQLAWRWNHHQPQHFPEVLRAGRIKVYIDQVLGVEAIPVALGIYFVFREEAGAQVFRQERFRSRATTQSPLSNQAV